jgi:uncharacterized protein YodC (DUF2158 family)
MKSINVIPVGTKVNLTEDVVGVVENITIYNDNYVVYNCSWWNGKSVDCKAFQAGNISPVTNEKVSIGFRV